MKFTNAFVSNSPARTGNTWRSRKLKDPTLKLTLAAG